MKRNASNILVCPINTEKILARVTKGMKENNRVTYSIMPIALIKLSNVVMTSDAVYRICELHKNEQTGKIEYFYQIGIHKKTYNAVTKMYTHQVGPAFFLLLPLRTIKSRYCDQPVTMQEFMGSRYNYNPRIVRNTVELLTDLNSTTV